MPGWVLGERWGGLKMVSASEDLREREDWPLGKDLGEAKACRKANALSFPIDGINRTKGIGTPDTFFVCLVRPAFIFFS